MRSEIADRHFNGNSNFEISDVQSISSEYGGGFDANSIDVSCGGGFGGGDA